MSARRLRPHRIKAGFRFGVAEKKNRPPAFAGPGRPDYRRDFRRLVHERLLLEPRDLILHVQFFSFQFRNFEAVARRMRHGFGDFDFQCLVPPFEFRKMRFDRHVAFLLAL
jgi:hypothetical protein